MIPYQTLDIPNDPTPWAIAEQPGKDWCVLWLQGWTSSIASHYEGIERIAKESGISFAMLDYAGHGKHPIPLEETTRAQQHAEVVALYDELKEQGYKNIITIGGSFGAYMAALLSEKRDLIGLVLRAPAIYNDDEFQSPQSVRDDARYRKFKKDITANSPLQALTAIKKYRGPVYILEHELDNTIPKNIPQAYFEAAQRGNYLVVPATDHSPKLMPESTKHYAYIESALTSILRLIQLEQPLITPRD